MNPRLLHNLSNRVDNIQLDSSTPQKGYKKHYVLDISTQERGRGRQISLSDEDYFPEIQ